MFFKPRTVDAAIAPLLKAVHDLEGVTNLCSDLIEHNTATIDRLESENTDATRERSRANGVLVALRGITNPTQE